jgi:hypothetical protein
MVRICLLCLVALLVSGCGTPDPSAAAPTSPPQPRTASPPQPTTAPAATAAPLATTDCPVTRPVKDQPPDDPNADSFGRGYWYINADRTIWVGLPGNQTWRVGGEKVIWIRPQGTELVITGERLDGPAPPLRADIPCCYPTGFQVTGLIFPTEGCWEVTAKAGDSELRFITKVAPGEVAARVDTCESLADAVKQSDTIMIGWVTDTERDDRYAWHNVSVMETWKLPFGWSGVGDRVSVLQDLQAEPQLEKNGRYLLFLQHDPWRLVCGSQSVLEQQGETATPLGSNPLWPGGTMLDLKREVDRLLATQNGR